MAGRITYRKKSQNRLSVFMAILVMLVILGAVGIRGIFLKNRLQEYDEKIEELQSSIAQEQRRAEEIEEYSKYVETNEFVEEYARDKLGLVREDEIIFKDENGQ